MALQSQSQSGRTPRLDPAAPGVAAAIDEVLRFGRKSWQSANWELVIKGSSQFRGIIACLDMQVLDQNAQPAVDIAATALRTKFPEFTRGSSAWKRKNWQEQDALEIVQLVFDQIVLAGSHAQLTNIEQPVAAPESLEIARSLPEQEWSPWQPFFNRKWVPNKPGLYMFALSPPSPWDKATPFADHVVYIGMTVNQDLVKRLDQFATSWTGKIGHSGAFTLRNAMLREGRFDEVRAGHTLFVSWKWWSLEGQAEIPIEEARLRQEYKRLHGQLPWANSV